MTALVQSHFLDAIHPSRKGVLIASATPQLSCPSMFTKTISVKPGKPNVPSGFWPCCGSNWIESIPFSLAQEPKISL